MVEIEIDGKTVEIQQGSMVMDAAKKIGTHIPHFCITRNCRLRLTVACVWLRLKKLLSLCLLAQLQ